MSSNFTRKTKPICQTKGVFMALLNSYDRPFWGKYLTLKNREVCFRKDSIRDVWQDSKIASENLYPSDVSIFKYVVFVYLIWVCFKHQVLSSDFWFSWMIFKRFLIWLFRIYLAYVWITNNDLESNFLKSFHLNL